MTDISSKPVSLVRILLALILANSVWSVEELFEVATHMYSIDENGQLTAVRCSVEEFRPMYVNLYGNHFSFKIFLPTVSVSCAQNANL